MTNWVRRLTLVAICGHLIIASLHAQDFAKQNREYLALNIGVNAVMGGIGALVNKKDGEKGHKVFLKGMAVGGAGGGISYLGKAMTYQINVKQNSSYAWLARLTHSAGSSITQNAMDNRDFWSRWYIHLGLARLEYDLDDRKFRARVLSSAVITNLALATQSKLDLGLSLRSGAMVYRREGNYVFGLGSAPAYGLATAIGMSDNIRPEDFYEVFAHEIVHSLQFDHFVWINPLLSRTDRRWKSNHKLYRQLSKYVYLDLNGPTIYGLYISQLDQAWICRTTEREAEHFAVRYALPRCMR